MPTRTLQEIRHELERLMLEQVASLRAQALGDLSKEELLKQGLRLKRIRELSADLLSAEDSLSGLRLVTKNPPGRAA